MINIAINGFGRIGKAAAKIILDQPNLNLSAINDLGDIKTQAHLLKYDSCYGIYEKEVGFLDNELIVNNKKINFYSEKDPSDLPWHELEIDVVIESTGIFLTKDLAKAHLSAGAKKIIITAPPKDNTPIYVIGSNAEKYDGESIISNASCTTNCIAPIMKIIDDVFKIEKSMMTTVHSYTADQSLVDGIHKDLRRARAGAVNIIPTTTGAAIATTKTINELEGKFDGLSIRVPTPVVSISDITALIDRKVEIADINKVLVEASDTTHAGVVSCSDEPLVSSDLIKNPASAIVDLSLTMVVDKNLIKIIAWYDNEWGYSNRLVELTSQIFNQ